MTQARRQLLPPNTALQAHCVQRCVRRAFLCGKDPVTGQDFSHRKAWIEERIRLISECFSVAIHAWAVMSNHLHIVLSIDPHATAQWSDDEVLSRWARLYLPPNATQEHIAHKVAAILATSEKINLIRNRLGNLSWLMKCLAEPIARRANAEDGCSGRFWEGRFKAQRLCDDKALLAAMAYVDLNPIRAGICNTLKQSRHTSIQQRLKTTANAPLRPIFGLALASPSITQAQYIALLNWTIKQTRHKSTQPAPAFLAEQHAKRWIIRVNAIESRYWRAIGEAHDLLSLAKQAGQYWLKGIRFARVLLDITPRKNHHATTAQPA